MKSVIKKTLIIGLLIYCFVFLIAPQVKSDTIYITPEILSETYSIDTNSFYVYDTSVYQIPAENEYYKLWIFINKFENKQVEYQENLPLLNYITYDRATSDSINIRLETKYKYYYEKPARKVKVNYRKVEVK